MRFFIEIDWDVWFFGVGFWRATGWSAGFFLGPLSIGVEVY